MRIAVVSLPLHTNYGGLLQSFALKKFLESHGHDVTVLDIRDKMPLPKWWKSPFVYAKRTLMRLFIGAGGPEIFREIRFRREYPVISVNTQKFIDRYISPRVINDYKEVSEGEYEAFVVGSDQVWRPRYFSSIEDAFLAFTQGWDVVRVSYAASFGTNAMEYDPDLMSRCARLLNGFDGVSVREESAVRICREWFDREDAVRLPDPVMLWDSAVYQKLAESAKVHPAKGRLLSYILDPSKEKSVVLDFISGVSRLQVHDISPMTEDKSLAASERVAPPVEDWLAGFADADFVVTDSFHGCVLAILFHKPFVAVGNSRRGMARLQSLLEMLDLDMRLVHGIDPEDDGKYFLSQPDWNHVDSVLAEERIRSEAFLKKTLHK